MELLILLVALTSICADANNSASCPLWHYRMPGSDSCQCGNSFGGAVFCCDGQIYLRVDYAMVWDSENNETIVAASRYVYHNTSAISKHLRIYSLISNDTTELQLNSTMCEKNNRDGFLCENCLSNYGPFPHSSKCYKCSDRSLPSAIALYLTLKFLPFTLLFFMIITFRINIIKGPMLGYIFFCQIHMLFGRESTLIYQTLMSHLKHYNVILKISFYLSSLWSLGFTNIVHPYCISDI